MKNTLLFLGLLLCCPHPSPAAAPAGAKRLNILFLMDDQQRGDWLGAAGAKWMITPNLDRLAHEGVLFRRGYTSTPSCLPARAALLTGMSPWGHGCLGYVPIPERYACEMPRVFTEAGWTTCSIGKNHFTPVRNGHGYETVIIGQPSIRDLPEIGDYRAWFDKQAPGHNPFEPFRSGNDQRGGVCYPFDEKLHLTHWTADQAVELPQELQRRPAVVPQGIFPSPARAAQPAQALVRSLRGSGHSFSGHRRLGGKGIRRHSHLLRQERRRQPRHGATGRASPHPPLLCRGHLIR